MAGFKRAILWGIFDKKKTALVVAILWGTFQVYSSVFGPLIATIQRSTHLGFALLLAYILYPVSPKLTGNKVPLIDIIFGVSAAVSCFYLAYHYEMILTRILFLDKLTTIQIVLGIVLILALIEATRRITGFLLVSLILIFIIYAFVGHNLTGILHCNPVGLIRLIDHQYLSTGGIFGQPIAVSSTYAFLFILFGALLEVTGVGRYLINCALGLTGSVTGGPAKVATIASGLMGSLSGSAVANVVTTGTFTIPLMKRFGYKPYFAAAVEAAASSGGQLAPPVMGVVAFIMAEYTGISYWEICIAGAIPAFLYYFSIFVMVHLEAKKNNLLGLPKSELPRILLLMKRSYLVIPLLVLVYFLVSGRTPLRAGLYAVGATFILGIVNLMLPENRENAVKDLKEFFTSIYRFIIESMVGCSKAAVIVAVTCGAAGIICGINSITGIGLRLSANLMSASGGSMLLILIILAFVSILLGMGMPGSAAYITVAAVLIPGLIWAGIPTLQAHMFAFYTTSAAAITPPVALAVYAAAPMAGASLFKTGIMAIKLGISMLILPFIFIYHPGLLMEGTFMEIAWVTLTTALGLFLITALFSNRIFGPLHPLNKLLALVAAILILQPTWFFCNAVGLAVFIAVILINKVRANRGNDSKSKRLEPPERKEQIDS